MGQPERSPLRLAAIFAVLFLAIVGSNVVTYRLATRRLADGYRDTTTVREGTLTIRGILNLETMPGSTDGGILRGRNPQDGGLYDLIEFGPEQAIIFGPARGPILFESRTPLNFAMRHINEFWDHKHTDVANDPNHLYAFTGTASAAFPTSSGAKVMQFRQRTNGDQAIMWRPGFIVQGGTSFFAAFAIAENRDGGAPGNKEIAFGLTANPRDPLNPASKGIFFHRDNDDGNSFGTMTVRVQNGGRVTETPLDDFGPKPTMYSHFHVYILEYIVGDSLAYGWMGDHGNRFNIEHNGVADAKAAVPSAQFGDTVHMVPFVLARLKQRSGPPQHQLTSVKAYSVVRRGF